MSETIAPLQVLADAALYALAALMICVAGAWVYLIKSMSATFRTVPRLGVFDGGGDNPGNPGNPGAHDGGQAPMVSVILPARNEERYIKRCLDSLAAQGYPNYEIVAIDDSSDDSTLSIIRKCAKEHPGLIIPVSARAKPDGWMGKNWACMEGFRRARGELLLFTDADTRHSPGMIEIAARYMKDRRLDVVTVMPRMLAPDFWIKSALPMISVFLHTRFSALKVNDPKSKTGYFFGSFFLIKRETYQSVGMHESVRGELIEDGALGRKTKEAGHRMQMVRGEHLVDAVWARDLGSLWNALKRLMIPLRVQNGFATAAGISVAVAFLLFVPFLSLGATAAYALSSWPGSPDYAPVIAASVSLLASALVWAGAVLESRTGLGIGFPYGLLAPLGGLVVTLGFFAGLTGSNPSLVWRGRTYSASDQPDEVFAAT